MIEENIELAGLTPGCVHVNAREINKLDEHTDGALLREGDPGWDDSVLLWNAMVKKRPSLVLRPASATDISTAITFARDHGLLLSVKGGGHNIAGTAVAESGLMLDMSSLRHVTVDPSAKLVRAGAGCLLQDVDRETQKVGLATVLGLISEVGIAGLTLGGGFGNLSRRFGWTVDNLEEVEIVTADGRLRTASRTRNEDLFWALRGGGGNFGVVTRFSYRLHEVGPKITGGLIAWSADQAEQGLEVYRELTSVAPRELTSIANIMAAPPAPFIPPEWHGQPIFALVICHTGPNPERDLAVLRKLGEPIVNQVGETTYTAQQQLLDETEPKGLMEYWKSEFLPDLSDDFLRTFHESAVAIKSQLSYSILIHLGGALSDRAFDDGAVGNRDAQFVGGHAGIWNPGEPDEPNIKWSNESWQRMRPFSTGGNYVNFQLEEDGQNRLVDAYRGNFARLQQVKRDYDPENLFRVNRNIAPSVASGEAVVRH